MALTKISNNSLSAISSLSASIPTGALTLLSTQTASASASIEFTSGIDSTYDSYVFKFINIHPQTLGRFQFNLSTDGGSNYNVTKTSTNFRAYHNEADTDTGLEYQGADDLAQSTSDQTHGTSNIGNNNDECLSGYLQIFNPSSSVYVKHYIMRNNVLGSDYGIQSFVAGYANTTSAVNAIIFRMASGNIDDGIIKMYGVS